MLVIALIPSCVDRKLLRENGFEYLHKTQDLAVIMNAVLDRVRDIVSKCIGLKFDKKNNEIFYIYYSNESQEGAKIVNEDDKKSRAWRLSTLLSSKSTFHGYNRLRTNMMK